MNAQKIYKCLIWFLISLFFLSIAGCGLFRKAPVPALKKVPVKKHPAFYDDMGYDGLEHSISQSLVYLKRLPPDRMFYWGKDAFDAAHMIKSLELFLDYIRQNPTPQELKQFIASNYLVYKSTGNNRKGRVLFTGYYEPFLQGSLKKSPRYRFPLYTLPTDRMIINISLFSDRFIGEKKLVGRVKNGNTVVPYFERKEIEGGAIPKEKLKPLAWVDDKVDLFFLEIQGSGIIYLDTGKKINVHYHGSNGHPYRSIGRLLIDEGKIPKEEMSMQAIRHYLSNHPDEVEDILNYNPSYVFFQEEADGPFGCLGVKLTPGRSLALQRKLFPSAALVFIETQKPLADGNGEIQAWADFGRFVLNQDTGGAIVGPGRADLFWGNGEYAKLAAGYMQHEGRFHFLVLKPDETDK